MDIQATLRNSQSKNDIEVSTNDAVKSITIPGKPDGTGSSINGGELLFLALATCFCNDIYREAAKRAMKIDAVDCTVNGNFGGPGEPGSNITYSTTVVAKEHSQQEIDDLIRHVDEIAEIHNTLRQGVAVSIQKRMIN